MQAVGRVGRKLTLYPPKEIMRRLGLEEGYEVVFRVEGDRLVIERLQDPWMLALKARKWSETTVEEFEKESEELQEEYISEEG